MHTPERGLARVRTTLILAAPGDAVVRRHTNVPCSMNATHIARGLMVFVPALAICEACRHFGGGVPIQILGLAFGVLFGVVVLYALGNFRRGPPST